MRLAPSIRVPNVLLAGLLTLLVSGATPHEAHGQSTVSPDSGKSGNPATPVLVVINRHFTMGKKIPSVYLEMMSDRTAECHTFAFSGREPAVTKQKTLRPEEFERLTALLDDPELLSVKSRYESPRIYIDSWMTWDIGIQRAGHAQTIEVVNFTTMWGVASPYPNALLRLGCMVLKLRDEVYGDEVSQGEANCKKILGARFPFAPSERRR
jgi:hypothetical protein